MNVMAIVVENTESKWKEGLKRNVDTRYTNPVLCLSRYARAPSCRPHMYEATMVSCFGLVGRHENGIADTWRGCLL